MKSRENTKPIVSVAYSTALITGLILLFKCCKSFHIQLFYSMGTRHRVMVYQMCGQHKVIPAYAFYRVVKKKKAKTKLSTYITKGTF